MQSLVVASGLVTALVACSSSPAGQDGRLADARADTHREQGADRPIADTLRPEARPTEVSLEGAPAADSGPTGALTVHLKRPAGWAAPRAHTWKSWPGNLSTTWPGAAMTDEGNGWSALTLAGQSSAAIVFNDGASGQTVDLWRERSGWFVPKTTVHGLWTGRWYDANPEEVPWAGASPAGGQVFSEGVVVTLALEGSATVSRYTTDGSDPKSSGTTYTDGQKLELAKGLGVGQALTLRLYAKGSKGEAQRTFVFQRVADPPAQTGDSSQPTKVTKSGRWVTLESFSSPQGLLARNVVIYLPADYDTSTTERWPVIYFHDGQRLDGTNEWMIDERYEELMAEGLITPAIVVGMYNTSDREAEYAGCNNVPKKAAYAAWVKGSLKPYIDSHYRTRWQPPFTATMGSSYGGLISHYLAWTFPDVFGGAGCLSTQFAFCTGPGALDELKSYTGGKKPVRYWIDAGSAEGASVGGGRSDYIQRNLTLAERLAANGWDEGTDLVFLEVPGGQHHETWWSKRVKKTLYFLLRKEAPRIARTEARTYLPSIGVGGTSYAATDVFFENDFWFTKLAGDTTPPFSFASKDPSVASLDAATGLVSGKKAGTTQLESSYQGFVTSVTQTVTP